MALYSPDYTLIKAKKLIDSLDNSEDNELIKYYIEDQQRQINKLDESLSEYREWFVKLDRFLPNKNIVYG